jgi:hypothetical protein
MKPSVFGRVQNAGKGAIEAVTVIGRHAGAMNSEEYIDNGTHGADINGKEHKPRA